MPPQAEPRTVGAPRRAQTPIQRPISPNIAEKARPCSSSGVGSSSSVGALPRSPSSLAPSGLDLGLLPFPGAPCSDDICPQPTTHTAAVKPVLTRARTPWARAAPGETIRPPFPRVNTHEDRRRTGAPRGPRTQVRTAVRYVLPTIRSWGRKPRRRRGTSPTRRRRPPGGCRDGHARRRRDRGRLQGAGHRHLPRRTQRRRASTS